MMRVAQLSFLSLISLLLLAVDAAPLSYGTMAEVTSTVDKSRGLCYCVAPLLASTKEKCTLLSSPLALGGDLLAPPYSSFLVEDARKGILYALGLLPNKLDPENGEADTAVLTLSPDGKVLGRCVFNESSGLPSSDYGASLSVDKRTGFVYFFGDSQTNTTWAECGFDSWQLDLDDCTARQFAACANNPELPSVDSEVVVVNGLAHYFYSVDNGRSNFALVSVNVSTGAIVYEHDIIDATMRLDPRTYYDANTKLLWNEAIIKTPNGDQRRGALSVNPVTGEQKFYVQSLAYLTDYQLLLMPPKDATSPILFFSMNADDTAANALVWDAMKDSLAANLTYSFASCGNQYNFTEETEFEEIIIV